MNEWVVLVHYYFFPKIHKRNFVCIYESVFTLSFSTPPPPAHWFISSLGIWYPGLSLLVIYLSSLREMDTFAREAFLSKFFLPSLSAVIRRHSCKGGYSFKNVFASLRQKGSTLKGRNFLLRCRFFPFRVYPFLQRAFFKGNHEQEVTSLSLSERWLKGIWNLKSQDFYCQWCQWVGELQRLFHKVTWFCFWILGQEIIKPFPRNRAEPEIHPANKYQKC